MIISEKIKAAKKRINELNILIELWSKTNVKTKKP
tara:strand:+ start:141 stop:245 length:105 start_codon:yes stop_codon:yes gene_type:complete